MLNTFFKKLNDQFATHINAAFEEASRNAYLTMMIHAVILGLLEKSFFYVFGLADLVLLWLIKLGIIDVTHNRAGTWIGLTMAVAVVLATYFSLRTALVSAQKFSLSKTPSGNAINPVKFILAITSLLGVILIIHILV